MSHCYNPWGVWTENRLASLSGSQWAINIFVKSRCPYSVIPKPVIASPRYTVNSNLWNQIKSFVSKIWFIIGWEANILHMVYTHFNYYFTLIKLILWYFTVTWLRADFCIMPLSFIFLTPSGKADSVLVSQWLGG